MSSIQVSLLDRKKSEVVCEENGSGKTNGSYVIREL